VILSLHGNKSIGLNLKRTEQIGCHSLASVQTSVQIRCRVFEGEQIGCFSDFLRMREQVGCS